MIKEEGIYIYMADKIVIALYNAELV